MRSKRSWMATTCSTTRSKIPKCIWTRSSHYWPRFTTDSVNRWVRRRAKANSSSKWKRLCAQWNRTKTRFFLSFPYFHGLHINTYLFSILDWETDWIADGEASRFRQMPSGFRIRGAPIPRNPEIHHAGKSKIQTTPSDAERWLVKKNSACTY